MVKTLTHIPGPLGAGTYAASDSYNPGGGPFAFGAVLRREGITPGPNLPTRAKRASAATFVRALDAVVLKGISANGVMRFVFSEGSHDAVALEGKVEEGFTGPRLREVVRGIISGLMTTGYQEQYGFASSEAIQQAGILLLRGAGSNSDALFDVVSQELVAAGISAFDTRAHSKADAFDRIRTQRAAGMFDLTEFPKELVRISLFQFHPARPGTIGERFGQIFSVERVGQFLTGGLELGAVTESEKA